MRAVCTEKKQMAHTQLALFLPSGREMMLPLVIIFIVGTAASSFYCPMPRGKNSNWSFIFSNSVVATLSVQIFYLLHYASWLAVITVQFIIACSKKKC